MLRSPFEEMEGCIAASLREVNELREHWPRPAAHVALGRIRLAWHPCSYSQTIWKMGRRSGALLKRIDSNSVTARKACILVKRRNACFGAARMEWVSAERLSQLILAELRQPPDGEEVGSVCIYRL